MFSLLQERLRIPILLLASVFFGGSAGYYLLGLLGRSWAVAGTPWALLDCAYMTAITLTTVGYGDMLHMDSYPLAKVYTIGLAFTGMGVALYAVSEATSFFVEGHIGTVLEERKRMKRVEKMKEHLIVCGLGETGTRVIQEFIDTRHEYLAIEADHARIERRRARFPDTLILEGDATDEDVLKQAGIERARGLVAALGEDKDNLFLVVTARSLRSDLKIVAKVEAPASAGKLRAAGATSVVAPPQTGGLRMASEMIRPHVVSFLDRMIKEGGGHRFEEVVVQEGSDICGRTIAESGIYERTGLMVIAIKTGDGVYEYNPAGSVKIDSGSTLVVISRPDQLGLVRTMGVPRTGWSPLG